MQNNAAILQHFANSSDWNAELPCDPAFPLLGIYSRETKTDVNTTMCVQMFKAALFLMAPKPRQRKCSTESQWKRRVRSPLKMQVSEKGSCSGPCYNPETNWKHHTKGKVCVCDSGLQTSSEWLTYRPKACQWLGKCRFLWGEEWRLFLRIQWWCAAGSYEYSEAVA